jgi:VanZ family protein
MRSTAATRSQKTSSRKSSTPFRRIGRVALWLTALAWAAAVLMLGTSLFSIVRTSSMLDPLLARLVPGLSANGLYDLQVFVRRSAHFAEYAILFLFLNFGPMRGRPVIAFMVCVGCASLDEGFQTLRPSRSGTIFDVALDSSGAAAMLVLAMPYWGRQRRLRQMASAA